MSAVTCFSPVVPLTVPQCTNLASDFLASAERQGNRLALSVRNVDYSYSELALLVGRSAAWLRLHGVGLGSRVGIVASRSLETLTGILASCWVGATYVPINVGYPGEALAKVVNSIKLDALIVDRQGLSALSGHVLDVSADDILAPGKHTLPASLRDAPVDVPPDVTAYIEFTSGTTGEPKGVMISTAALSHFLSVMHDRYQLTPHDRVAGTSDITFDVSFANMFMAGASLHVLPASQLLTPSKFIRDRELTIWFSVPSVARSMRQMNLLPAGVFPRLRYSLFAGEPLPLDSALAWQEAAPQSLVENLYGPTEATVVCTGERVGRDPRVTRGRGVIAIGRPLPGTDVAIVDADLNFLPPEAVGQIALSGIQLSQGYYGQPELTKERFPVIDRRKWYLTGDLGYEDSSGAFHHLGRIDNQVKISGRRVELEEVEYHLREVCGCGMVAAVAWPVEYGSAQGLVAFISGTECPPSVVREEMKKRVLRFLVPQEVRVLDALPLNPSGKIDRKALLGLLRSDSA
ncbi:MAG: AMP-binding protein [Terriglobia bacterium]